jgi:hypothetical protein
MFGILPQPTQDYYLVCVVAVAVCIGVAAVVYLLSWTHALLPHEHNTICDITGATKSHFLSYVTQDEMEVLIRDHDGWGTASKGLMGSQGVRCFDPTTISGTKAARSRGWNAFGRARKAHPPVYDNPRTLHVNKDGSRLQLAPPELSDEERNRLRAAREQ